MENNNLFIIPSESKSIDEWIFETITPIIIVIDEIMKQILTTFTEFENGLY